MGMIKLGGTLRNIRSVPPLFKANVYALSWFKPSFAWLDMESICNLPKLIIRD